MHRLVAEGYYGMRNAGDDAFCLVTAALAPERWGVEKLAFVAPASRLPELPRPARCVLPDPPRFRGHARLAALGAKLRAHHVAHVGGSVMNTLTGRQRDENRLARLGLLTLHAVGVSAGPFASAEQGARTAAYLSRFTTLHLRDTASRERLEQVAPGLRPRVGFDVAVLLPELDFCRATVQAARSRDPSEFPVIGVSVCRDATLRGAPSESQRRRERSVVAVLRELATRQPVRYRFIVFNSHPAWGDDSLTRRTADALGEGAEVEVVPYTGDVRSTLGAVAGCDALLGTRLHSAIFAYACQVPFAVIAYRPKGADFAYEAGLPERFLFPAEGPPLGAGVEAMSELLQEGTAILDRMLPPRTARARASAGFDPL